MRFFRIASQRFQFVFLFVFVFSGCGDTGQKGAQKIPNDVPSTDQGGPKDVILPSNYSMGVGQGGHIVQCEGQEAMVLDYHQSNLPTMAKEAQLIQLGQSVDDVVNAFKVRLKGSLFEEPFESAIVALGKPDTWKMSTLTLVQDYKLAYSLPSNCKLSQAAIRQNSTVFLDREAAKLMSPIQLGILYVHEAFYYIAKNSSYSSESVRNSISALLQKDSKPSRIARTLLDMGFNFLLFQELTGRSFYFRSETKYDKVHRVVFSAGDPATLEIEANLQDSDWKRINFPTFKLICDQDDFGRLCRIKSPELFPAYKEQRPFYISIGEGASSVNFLDADRKPMDLVAFL